MRAHWGCHWEVEYGHPFTNFTDEIFECASNVTLHSTFPTLFGEINVYCYVKSMIGLERIPKEAIVA